MARTQSIARKKTSTSSTRKKVATKKVATKAKKAPAKAKKAKVLAPPPPANDAARQNAMTIAKLALDKKALQVVVIDVRGLASYAEYLVVMTAESDPQIKAIADHVEQKMREHGERPLGVEGSPGGRWLLIDFGEVVAHIFFEDTRMFYDIEGLWADASRISVTD